MDLYQELLDGAHYVRQEIEERAIATSSNAGVVGTVLLPLLDALGWDESKGEPVEWARAVVFARNEAQALIALRVGEVGELRAEIESLKAGLRALANVRDEGAAETARWRDRALGAESSLDGALRCVEEMKRNGAMFERFAANQRRALADVLSRTPEDLIADPTHDDLMRAARMLREEFSGREHALEQVRALATQVEAERDQARAEIEHVSADLDCLGALSEETKALRGERDDLLVQMAAKTRETEEAQRERDLAIAAGLGIEAERAQAVAMLNEDENDPETPCRCGQISGACRSCLASALSEDHLAALADHLAPRAPALANEIRSAGESYPPSGAPDPAQESPQATETQPDPGEGWRLLGPEEVIETGDQWWGGAMVGPVWLVASATIGETPAAINAHPRATERRVFRRLITAPIAPAPAVEPVTEVAIEVRGSKFVIVRRAVAP